MTTDKLRRLIHVSVFYYTNEGIEIKYILNSESFCLKLNIISSFEYLTATNLLDDYNGANLTGNIDGEWISWDKLICNNLSQWDALNIAIRYEEEKQILNDSNLLEMDKAIEALKNS